MKHKLMLRETDRFNWLFGYYDKCKCGYACDKHFRVVESISKTELTPVGAREFVNVIISENAGKYYD